MPRTAPDPYAPRTQRDQIRHDLDTLVRAGAVEPSWQLVGQRPGLRWLVTPTGYSERSMTTRDVRFFIIGALSGICADVSTPTDDTPRSTR